MTEQVVRRVLMSKSVALKHLQKVVNVRPHIWITFATQEDVQQFESSVEARLGSEFVDQLKTTIDNDRGRIGFSHPELHRMFEMDQIADEMGFESSGVK